MSQPPIISVVLTVYNASRYVGEAVESVLNQTFGDFELICVDDGSTDDSLEILRRFEVADARVRVISRPNTGCWKASNDGIEASRGRLIARMDADDICYPERFEKQVGFLNAHPEVVAVGTHVLLIDAEGEPLRTMPDPGSGPRLTHEEIDEGLMRGGGQVMYHPSVMIRREALERIGYYREWPAALDLDLFLRLGEVGRLANLPEVLLKYRQHMQSIGHARMKEQLEVCRRMVEDAYRRRGLPLPPDGRIGFEKIMQLSETDQHRKWAWWALEGGHVSSARKHARRALLASPFSRDSWKVMYCSLRGR